MLFYVTADKQAAVKQALSELTEFDFDYDTKGATVCYAE